MRVLLMALALGAAACSPKPQHPAASPLPQAATPAPGSSGLPPLEVHSHGNSTQPDRIIEREGNRKIYELLAKSTESTMQSQSHFQGRFFQTHITFYATDGSTLTGDAPVTQIESRNQTVTMSGGVTGRTSDGVELSCDQLQYSRGTGQLRGTGNVHIVKSSDGLSMTGGSFTSDLKLTQVHMQ